MVSLRSGSPPTGLGIGVVWWPELDPLCRPEEGLVSVIEVEPETFWTPRGVKPSGFTSRLASTLQHLPQPKLLHGVGAPFGGTVMQSAWHCETLSGDIAALRPLWISDHLSFNQFDMTVGENASRIPSTGFFLPPAQCPAGVRTAAEHIRLRQVTTGVPVAFEVPVSYLPVWPGEMPDGTFAAEVAEAADCGILLDLHNILCNERNGRQTVADFCNAIPLDRVWEIHLAGGQPSGRYWLDSHSGLVEPELIDILVEIVPRLPALGSIIFELGADYIASVGLAAIAKQLGRLIDVWASRALGKTPSLGRAPSTPTCRVHTNGMAETLTPPLWTNALGSAVTGLARPHLPEELDAWIRDAGDHLELYRFLANETRASSLVEAAPRTIYKLLRHLRETQTRALLARFWCQSPPAYTVVEDAWAFLEFVAWTAPGLPGLQDDIYGDRTRLLQHVNEHAVFSPQVA